MADQENSRRLWISLIIGFIFVGLAFWLSSGSDVGPPSSGKQVGVSGLDEELSPAKTHEAVVPVLRIAVGKRLTIAERDLPREGSLALTLDVSDLARGTGRRRARIVSETAGRLETEAVPLPGTEAGLHLEISRKFLARGLYLIEIETADSHPLRFRRYVLEIE